MVRAHPPQRREHEPQACLRNSRQRRMTNSSKRPSGGVLNSDPRARTFGGGVLGIGLDSLMGSYVSVGKLLMSSQ